MASAVLASGNESSWAQSGGAFMGKLPFLNPNPNPSKKQKQFHHQSAGGGRSHRDYSPAVTQTASDDAYSFNQKPPVEINRNSVNHGGYTTYSISSYTKGELSDLRRQFMLELEQIQNLRDRIESGQFSGGNLNNPRFNPKSKKSSGGGVKRSLPAGSGSNREGNKFSDGLVRGNMGNVVGDIPVDNERLLKECKQILSKLMKPKNCRIFNTPVDAKLLGLHDYHLIVKRPMDLGTVKNNIAKGRYLTPSEFAADVRLTFNNALLYNPKTDPVNGLAEHFLDKFEELFRPIQQQISGGTRREYHLGSAVAVGGSSSGYGGGQIEELQGSSWNHIPTPERPKKIKSSPVVKKERMQAHSTASTQSHPLPPQPVPTRVQSPAPSPSPVRSAPVKQVEVIRPSVPKLPKPRAKDPVKRDMTLEEKHKLGAGLQNLPQEKMHQLLMIIKKRNEHLAQDGDEIELDIEALDTETLWELDRFVTNWKKMVSKTKRQASMIGNPATPTAAPSTSNADMDEGAASDRNDLEIDDDMPKSSPQNSPKKVARKEAGDEDDVDIDDDDMPVTSFPPVEIEKDEGLVPEHGNVAGAGAGGGAGGGASSSSSSSSSSGSDSSSSSDSDSGSSSGSDSDADDAQS